MAGSVRRVQATGGGSYVVTLPKEWVKRYGLEAGGEVFVEQLPDGSLWVRPLSARSGGTASSHVRIEAGEASAEELLRWVVSYYIAGVDVIEVDVGKRGQLVREIVPFVSSRLMGVEVVEESSDRVVFQVVVDPASMPLDKSFSRLTRTVGYMLEDAARGLEAGDSELLGSIPGRDDVVDKLFIFVWRQVFLVLNGRRLVRELGAHSLADAVLTMTAAKHVERIGDHVSNVATLSLSAERGCWRGLARVLDEVKSVYKDAVQVFNKPSRAAAEEAMRRCLAARQGVGERLATVCSSGQQEPLHGIVHGLRRIVDYSIDIVELAMNRFAVWWLKESSLPARGR